MMPPMTVGLIRRQVCLSAILAAPLGCGGFSDLEPIELTSIEPSEIIKGESVAVRISGGGFHLQLRADLNTNEITAASIVVEIEGTSLQNIVLVGEDFIQAQVPGSLASGTHDVRVVFPDGREAVLAEAFNVIPGGPFGAAQPVPELDTGKFEDDPTLPADMLEIYFNRGESVGSAGDIWVARRGDVDSPFSAPEPVVELNTADLDGEPRISLDGLTMHIGSSRAGGQGSTDIYLTTRPDRQSPWSPPVPVTELNTNRGETLFSTDLSQTHAVFSRFGGGPLDLYQTSRVDAGDPWSPPVEIDELNTSADDGAGHLSGDGLTLYFYSGGRGGQGIDLYRTRRNELGSPWGEPEALDEVNTAGRDEDPWVSPDGMTIYYVVDGNIHMATR